MDWSIFLRRYDPGGRTTSLLTERHNLTVYADKKIFKRLFLAHRNGYTNNQGSATLIITTDVKELNLRRHSLTW